MPSDVPTGRSDRSHASDPRNDEPGIFRLYVGMTVAPFAWAIQVLIGYSLAAYACYPKALALDRPLWPGLRTTVAIATAACWVLLAVGCVVAWHNWRATGFASDAPSQPVPRSGDGRARFMALAGLFVSVGFGIALLFTSIGIAWVPACGP